MKLATCHPNRKAHARGLCGACYQKWRKENVPGAREKYKAYQSDYHAEEANKKRAQERLKYRRKSQEPGYADKRRNWMLTQKYGLTLVQYAQMLADQNGGCAICTRKPGARPLHVDHCHTTGAVRGLLCHQCNWYLGTLEGGPKVFTNLLTYMEKHNVLTHLKRN